MSTPLSIGNHTSTVSGRTPAGSSSVTVATPTAYGPAPTGAHGSGSGRGRGRAQWSWSVARRCRVPHWSRVRAVVSASRGLGRRCRGGGRRRRSRASASSDPEPEQAVRWPPAGPANEIVARVSTRTMMQRSPAATLASRVTVAWPAPSATSVRPPTRLATTCRPGTSRIEAGTDRRTAGVRQGTSDFDRSRARSRSWSRVPGVGAAGRYRR